MEKEETINNEVEKWRKSKDYLLFCALLRVLFSDRQLNNFQ